MTKKMIQPRPMLFPVPAVMVSCGLVDDRANIITIAWAGTVCSEPPMVSIGIQPIRHSHGIISELGEFVVNIPSSTQVKAVDYCGIYSGRDVDKFSQCGLTKIQGDKVKAPIIKECPINLECKVVKTVSLGSHNLFIGEIVQIQHDESIFVNGRIDVKKVDPLAYGGGEYWDLHQVVAKRGVGR